LASSFLNAENGRLFMDIRIGRGSIVLLACAFLLAIVAIVSLQPSLVSAAVVANPLCSAESVTFNPGNGEDIVVPPGYKVSVFKAGLNGPTGIAFRGNAQAFEVFVLESGHGLPSICNDETSATLGGSFGAHNPFTPDILVFDQHGTLLRGPLGKPTGANGKQTGGLQSAGPAIDIAFEWGRKGGRLFATDSAQAIREVGGQNNSSRIVTVDPTTGKVTPFITGLPTGDHPSEQLAFRDGWIYWSQGSTTNSGVVGLDNGGGNNQQDIPCQDITLSQNVFLSGDGKSTSGYSPHGVARPGAFVPAFASATGHGICDGAILRAKLNAANPKSTIEPFSWGYRNPFGLRFAPKDHALQGQLFVTENGEDERGARPTNNSPDRLAIAKQNKDGSPDYHGWPDRFGFLDSTQAVFNPVGGPGDDLCVGANNPPSNCTPASLALILKNDIPVKHLFAAPPQPVTAPLAIEPADVAVVGVDFVPKSFATGVVKRGAALVAREGDFGFSAGNGQPEAGHDIELVNFSHPGEPLELKLSVFAHNSTFDQAFPDGLRGINRPTNLRFGPDACAYLVDYGAVRDFGQSDPGTKFKLPADAPLVQIPGTGVIWKICGPHAGVEPEDDD
jgi:glucose/arabinose dehydrogenase